MRIILWTICGQIGRNPVEYMRKQRGFGKNKFKFVLNKNYLKFMIVK